MMRFLCQLILWTPPIDGEGKEWVFGQAPINIRFMKTSCLTVPGINSGPHALVLLIDFLKVHHIYFIFFKIPDVPVPYPDID